jgi:hypothetical protein
MIRPFTCVCLLLAGGAGLFLYQSKHRTRVLDQQIEQTVKQVDAVRSRIGILQAEWALLNDPQRLAELSDRFLALKPVAPAQFVTLADLDRRLPAPLPPSAATAAVASEPAGADATPESAGSALGGSAAEAEPAAPPPTPAAEPPRPRAAPAPIASAIAKAAHPAETRRVANRRDQYAAEPAASLARNERAHVRPVAERETVVPAVPDARPIPLWRAAPAPVLASAATVAVRPARTERSFAEPPRTGRPVGSTSAPSMATGGSLLGGAHMAVAPPVPISDAAWSAGR